MTPGGLIFVAILAIYVLLVRGMFKREYYGASNNKPTLRAFRRSLVCAVFFGFGALGVEGFGLPVPSLMAISVCLLLGADELLRMNVIAFGVSWALLFVIFFLREHYIESIPSLGTNPNYGRFGLRQHQANKSRRLLKGLSIASLAGAVFFLAYVIRSDVQLPEDGLTYAEREFLPRGLGHASEVQRLIGEFYAREGRLPCQEDNIIDMDQLLKDAHHDWEVKFTGCGRFIVSLSGYRRNNPIAQFTGSPAADADGPALDWTCVSREYERIEELTEGRCTFWSPSSTSR